MKTICCKAFVFLDKEPEETTDEAIKRLQRIVNDVGVEMEIVDVSEEVEENELCETTKDTKIQLPEMQ